MLEDTKMMLKGLEGSGKDDTTTALLAMTFGSRGTTLEEVIEMAKQLDDDDYDLEPLIRHYDA